MTVERPSLRTEIRESLASGEFPAAVLWGALACGFLTLLEYNLTSLGGGSATVSYAPLVGGAVAGLLCTGPRSTAATAGAYASGIATLSLSMVLFGIYVVETVGTVPLGWAALLVLFGALVVIPLVTGFAAAFGYLSAHVAHWALEASISPRGEETDR